MSEQVKCEGCGSTHPSKEFIDQCFVCGASLCFRCCRARTVKTTGRTVRVCRRCVTGPDDRLK